MIGHLRGELVIKHPPQLLIDVAGVGYELQAPMSTFYALPSAGEAVTLLTHLQVRDDAHILYGFATEGERSLFRNLLKVNGVGAKMALAILSGMEAETFRRCVQQGDADALVRLPGIGKKTAQRLVIEMRDRLESENSGAEIASLQVPQTTHLAVPSEDAVRALISLGYKPPEASRMVNRIDSEGKTIEDIIRLALKNAS